MDLNDPANIVNLSGHEGPHPQNYHQWVYDRLSNALRGIDKNDKNKLSEALRAELRDIAKDLLDDPDLLNSP